MKGFFRRVSPRRAVTDFHEQWKQPTPHRWQILGVAIAATFCVFMLFIPDSQRGEIAPPDVMYISTFEEGRSEGEIIASNCANQELKNEIQAAIAANEQARREMYEALGRATFIDVDSMKEEIAEEQAAEQPEDTGPTAEELALSLEEYCANAAG
ncbi:hypothetical protein [Aurantiacibacter odishensis]|uniref:hypothetical protein n=1 Tax=Aurantiacibacter odishensis TaxID=1155476 RepID=UPI000E730BF4|nr:hypothetical protein [Aurantiacibacter odishensis]